MSVMAKKSARKSQFLLYVDEVISAYLEGDFVICPHCGVNVVLPWHKSGTRFGICDTCHKKLKARAHEQALSYLEAQREYDASRQKTYRKRKEIEAADGRS